MGRTAVSAGGWYNSVVRAKRGQPTNKTVPAKKAAPKKSTPKKAPAKKRVAIKGDPINNILAKMAEMDGVGITEVKEQEVLKASGYANRDSKGFRQIWTKLNKELGYATRRNIKSKTACYTLTDKGRNHLLETGVIVVAAEPKTNEEFHAQLLEKMEKICVAPEGRLADVFEALKDGNWHSIPDILKVSGYGSPDSKGFRSIMSSMRKLDLVDKKKEKLRLKDTAFKFGRP